MAKAKSRGDDPAAGWAGLTWDDLEEWAGGSSVSRGRTYQRGGRVKDLAVSGDGALLATVVGTERYATTVSLKPKRGGHTLESACTCPIGGECKHAVAVVAEYLQAIAEKRDVPPADDEDPRWADLEDAGADGHGDEDESWDDDAEDAPPVAGVRAGRPARRGAAADWDAKIEQHLRAKTQGELADLVWSLVRRFPEVYQEFRERIALQEGDVGRLLAEARREIKRVTAEPAWRNHWSDEGHTPDYSRIRHRFERLLELGHADEVVSLGREFLAQGLQQVQESNDEGETYEAFAECLPVVFRALAQSSLSGPERLLYAIDAELNDETDAIGQASEAILDAPVPPEDWSAVADNLAARLKDAPADDEDSFSRDYRRDRLTNWVAQALRGAGRDEELRALYESEARATGSYERLIEYLLEARQFDDAERWAREGIAAVGEKYPGTADQLAGRLGELARKRKQWDVVAAHAARPFFEHPSRSSFDELVKAAAKAGVEEPVRAAALRFLETGAVPYQVTTPRPETAPAPRTKKRSGPPPPAGTPEPGRLKVDPAWPLPVPDYLAPLLGRRGWYDSAPRPHLEVLLEMAIADGRPDEVLRWFDKMRAGKERPDSYGGPMAYADRVAEAVAATHPERTAEIYLAALNAQLPHAHHSAYEAATGYLKKLRPVYEGLGRAADWAALLASVREKYRNRPRFMELLDRLDGRTIVQSKRPRR